jgi:hypothetical protein
MFATPLDKGRLFLEVVLLAAVVVLLHQQWWQYRVFKLQQLPHTCFLGHGWNLFELVRWVHGGPCAAPGAAAVRDVLGALALLPCALLRTQPGQRWAGSEINRRDASRAEAAGLGLSLVASVHCWRCCRASMSSPHLSGTCSD